LLVSCHVNNNNNNNNNNSQIYIKPYGRNFRGAGGKSDQCSQKAWVNKNVFSLHLVANFSLDLI